MPRPYTAADFRRQDESDDQGFYNAPRFVTHIDKDAIDSIRNFYAVQFAEAEKVETRRHRASIYFKVLVIESLV